MNEISLQPGLDTQFGYGGSPYLSGYGGSGSDATWGCNGGPSTDGAESTQQQAMSDIMKAAQTHNPEQRMQLLQQALALLQGNGASDPAGDPTPGSTPASQNASSPAPMQTPASDPAQPDPTQSDPTQYNPTQYNPNATQSDPTQSDPSQCDPTGPSAGCNGPSAGGGLTRSGNSVNTGEYTITAGTKDDGSLTITNNATHQSTEVWGDPHIKVNGQNTADFQKDNLNIQLQDGTVVHIQPTATNSQGVSHIGQVSVTKGNQAVTMGGTGADGFADGVNTSGVMNDGHYQSALYNTPTATDVTLGADGNLYNNNANGSMGGEITPSAGGGPTDLDGAGGGLAVGPSAASSPQDTQQLERQLMAMLGQQQPSFYSMMMMQELQHMMSQPQQRSQSV